MKLLFLLLFNLFAFEAQAASCCVSNTSVPNLMILPSRWQQTLTLASARVIGDVDVKGQSTFRRSSNRDETNFARMDLAYRWTKSYQGGVSARFQNRTRSTGPGAQSSDSGWSDVGLFHAWQPIEFQRTFIFQNINIPTAKSNYDSRDPMKTDARGSGTYLANLGVFHLENFRTFDLTLGGEFHHAFERSFETQGLKTRVGPSWGGSISVGGGYIPWKSKFRYGTSLTPRYEGPKVTQTNGNRATTEKSLVWDSVLNVTYSYDAEMAFGLTYLDQTFFGPARNTLLNRSLSFLFQMHWL